MAEKLSVVIALEGAEEIKRQLAEVGQAGKDAFAEINQAAAEVGGFNKLDPSVVTEKLKAAGDVGSEAFNKINTAVKQAGRMETLVNGLKAVENGLAGIKTAALSLGETMAKGLVRSLTLVARLLPAAFAAATVGAIVSTTKAILELDAAAIKLGISAADLAKAREIFKQLGVDSAAAAKGVAEFSEAMTLKNVKEAAANLDEFGRSANSGADWFKILEEAAKGVGPAADMARAKLLELGRARISGPEQDIDRITKSATALPDKILAMISVFEKMGNTAERNRLIFANFSAELATTIIQMLNAGVSSGAIATALAKIAAPTQAAADAAALLSLEWQKLKDQFSVQISPEALNAIALSLGQVRVACEAVGRAFVAVNAAIISAFSGDLFSNTIREINTIIGLLAGLGEAGYNAMKYIESAAVAVWQTVIGWINKAIQAVKDFFGAGGGQAAGAGAQGMARGGFVGGRGSGTSDLNLAWLSRGEHIMPARAVRQPGVLQLLEALRRSGGNLRGVLDRMGHFALGGLVGAPAFAGGGLTGMSHVTIQFPGLQPITGLRASSAVVDELRRSAALAQVRSGGRKPTRYT